MSAFHHQKARKEDRQPRSCLSCKETFESRWIGERICSKCKSNEAWRDGDIGEDYEILAS